MERHFGKTDRSIHKQMQTCSKSEHLKTLKWIKLHRRTLEYAWQYYTITNIWTGPSSHSLYVGSAIGAKDPDVFADNNIQAVLTLGSENRLSSTGLSDYLSLD